MSFFMEPSSERLSNLQNNEATTGTLMNDKKFEWGYLRRKCRNLELEHFYKSYMQRLRISCLGLFLFIQALAVLVHLVSLFLTVRNYSKIYFDLAVYSSASILVWIILSVNFREELIKRHSWIMYLTSWLAISILVIADLSVPIYHATTNQDILRPTNGAYVLYAVYIFMPIPENVHAFILGMAVTTCYMVNYGFITYNKYPYGDNSLNTTKFLSELIFLVCVNISGIFFRMLKEITVRTTFLDRRQCVEENLLLRYARDQEKSLLLSIIPAQIANKIEQDVKMRIEHLKQQNTKKRQSNAAEGRMSPISIRRWRRPESEKLFIEPHDDVTILYADVVNYTYLTTTLDVKTLVETLHDLFVKFDIASEEHNVLRIKFLGDCYYCVAGVPLPNEQHAKCCVDLGLRMIKDIRDVRMERNLNIDMRIGVHSGNILSGVIGASKWQYDIWSKDVDIANRLEATGEAGRVHVSEQTLKLLDGAYVFEEGTVEAKNDAVLRKYRIRTFLIKPPRASQINLKPMASDPSSYDRALLRSASSTNFMQNTIVQYNSIRAQTKLEMSRELDKMPINRIQITEYCFVRSKRLTQDEMEQQTFRSNTTSMCLFFKDWRWEVLFMKEPDEMLKYSILFAAMIFFAIFITQIINNNQSTVFWAVMCPFIILLLAALTAAWYKKLWIMIVGENELSRPENVLSGRLYNLSELLQGNIQARVTIYILILFLYCACAMIQFADCQPGPAEQELVMIQLFEDGVGADLCFNAWAVTESMMLAMAIAFLFTRIPFILKFVISILIFSIYAIFVAVLFDFIYEKGPSTNVDLYPEYAHLLVLFMTMCIYHLMDRQTEFISKVDFNWKRQLQKKQEDAKFTNETIKILINNILPSHVADIYITKKIKNELYYEEYENVAVMFATIKNFDTEKVGLRVLNEIICDFDDMLHFYRGNMKVEKIKVAGWTYMAACGLDVSRSEHTHANRTSSLLPNGRRSYSTMTRMEAQSGQQTTMADITAPMTPPSMSYRNQMSQYEGHAMASGSPTRIRKISHPDRNSVVYVMTQFALDLIRTMHSFNRENLQNEDEGEDCGVLRIGISNGEVMAGVVGSYKPHYDIWGNAVNMASRMDSTGILGNIQVTEETAKILETFDVKCTERGLTFVKGRGEIKTFFVDIDKDLNFVSVDGESDLEGSSNPSYNDESVRDSSIQNDGSQSTDADVSAAPSEVRVSKARLNNRTNSDTRGNPVTEELPSGSGIQHSISRISERVLPHTTPDAIADEQPSGSGMQYLTERVNEQMARAGSDDDEDHDEDSRARNSHPEKERKSEAPDRPQK